MKRNLKIDIVDSTHNRHFQQNSIASKRQIDTITGLVRNRHCFLAMLFFLSAVFCVRFLVYWGVITQKVQCRICEIRSFEKGGNAEFVEQEVLRKEAMQNYWNERYCESVQCKLFRLHIAKRNGGLGGAKCINQALLSKWAM